MRRYLAIFLVLAMAILPLSPALAAGLPTVILGLEAVEYTSCPYIYVDTGDGYVLENDLISVARTQANEYTDYLFINNMPNEDDGKIKIKIEEPSGESSMLDLLGLSVVSHPEGTKAGIGELGEAHTYSDPAPPISAVGNEADVLDKVTVDDGEGSLLYDGESIVCEFPATDFSKGAKLVLKVDGFERNGDLSDELDIKVPAIEIQTQQSGQWVTRSKFFPKAMAAYGVFDIKQYLDPASPRVRILSKSCRINVAHLIDYIALDNTADQCNVVKLPLVSAVKNGSEDVLSLISDPDGNYLEMIGEKDVLELEYGSIKGEGLNDYFFTSKGYYEVTGNTFYIDTKDAAGEWVNRTGSTFMNYSGGDYLRNFNLTAYQNTTFFPEPDGTYKVRVWNRMRWYPQVFAYIDHVYLDVNGERYDITAAVDEATGQDILKEVSSSDDIKWDAFKKSAVITFSKAMPNRAPIAIDDFYSVDEDNELAVKAPGVLANDLDPDGDALRVSALRPISGPSNGRLSLNEDGSFVYMPNPNFNGIDSFTYKANDGELDSGKVATANIKVYPVNDTPVIDLDSKSVKVDEGQEAVNTGKWTDIDPGDAATLSASVGNIAQSKDGTWSWSFNSVDGPDDSQIVTITAKDKEGAEGTASFYLTVNNVAPAVNAGEDQTVKAGDTLSFYGSFIDPGALDTHSIEWDFGDGNVAVGTLTPTHTYYKKGTYKVTLKVTDKDGGVGVDAALVTVKPILASIDIDPDTLNLDSNGKWITAYIELPSGYGVDSVDIASIMLNGTVLAESDLKYGFVKDPEIMDRDGDGLPELMIKFDRKAVQAILKPANSVTLTVSGRVLYNKGFADFEGSDSIRVIQNRQSGKN